MEKFILPLLGTRSSYQPCGRHHGCLYPADRHVSGALTPKSSNVSNTSDGFSEALKSPWLIRYVPR